MSLPVDAAESLKVIALGDSTTAGTPGFRSPVESPPEGKGDPKSQFTHRISERHPEWMLLNRGVAGERSDQIRERMDADIEKLRPNIIIVLGGVNDLYQGYPAAWVIRNLELMYARAVKAGIGVIACTILPYDVSTPEVKQRMDEVNAWIRDFSQRHGIGFCDTFTALEHPERPGTLRQSPDGLHPDVESYALMGDTITECLEQVLKI